MKRIPSISRGRQGLLGGHWQGSSRDHCQRLPSGKNPEASWDRGYIGAMLKGYIGIMENEMETTID